MDGQTVRRSDGRTVKRGRATWFGVLAVVFLSVGPSDRLTVLLAQEPAPAPAQAPTGPQVIDRIVAIVGDKAILLSEVDEKIAQARSQGLQIPSDSTQLLQLRRQMLSNMIDEEVIYQQARRDTSVTVTDAEVQTAIDAQMTSVRGQFHTEQEFRTALVNAGLGSPEEYRRFLSEQTRRQQYGSRYIDHLRQEGKLRPGTVSEPEMRRFFDDLKASGRVGRLPASVTFKQVILSPRPTAAERQRAYARADSVRLALEHGADFQAMARRFSDDITTKENGGDLGWFRRGQMVRQFEEAAFQLRPGVPSPVVQTEYGYHVILVDRVQPGQVKARHILFAPAVSDSERALQRARADTVAAQLRAGVPADSLARMYGDSGETVTVGPTDRAQLPSGYAQAFTTVAPDQILGPVALNPETPDRPRLLVARITAVTAEREATFEDKRDEVRGMMLQQKGVQNLVEDLKKTVYVNIRL